MKVFGFMLILYIAVGSLISLAMIIRLIPSNVLRYMGPLDAIGKRAYFENKIIRSNRRMLEQKYGKDDLMIWASSDYKELTMKS
jgi:hypothetical protein